VFDREREGRPRKIDEEVEREIKKLLQTDPTEEGENASRWTTPRIAEYLERELGVDVYGVEISAHETVREALKRLEYSWTRPRRTLREGPDYEERLAELAERIGWVNPATTVLFADETEVKRFPPLRRIGPVEGQKAVWVPEQTGDFALYGALDICTGETYTEAFDREVSDHTVKFLKQVRTQTTGKGLLIWDQASWHTSKRVQGFLEDLGRFETLRLPRRAPEANPMEDLWQKLCKQVAACLEWRLASHSRKSWKPSPKTRMIGYATPSRTSGWVNPERP
jgi:transposase